MTGVLCALVGSGGALDTQAVTVGITFGCGKFGCFDTGAGYNYTGADGYTAGSISDGTFNPAGGATIQVLDYNNTGKVEFQVAGSVANSGWTSLDIGGVMTLNRADATFTTSSGYVTWSWSVGSNPFGTTAGVVIICTFR